MATAGNEYRVTFEERRSEGGWETLSVTPKQEAFCLAYLETGNASEAKMKSDDGAENRTQARPAK